MNTGRWDTDILRFAQTPESRLLGILAICGVVLVIYLDTLASMAGLWDVERYRHAYAVPFLSAFLLWRARGHLSQPWTFSWTGFVMLLLAVSTWLVARATLVQVVEHVALFLMVNGAVWSVAGDRVYRSIFFPMAFLAFALPIGGSIVPFLMEVTADLSSLGLHLLGVPVFRQGMVLTLPGGAFEVADVCSGIRYLNVGLTLGTFLAFLSFRNVPKRVLYVGALGVVFVLTNGLRAFIVMAVASATEMKYLAGADHIYFGWVMFLIAMLLMFWVAERYSDA